MKLCLGFYVFSSLQVQSLEFNCIEPAWHNLKLCSKTGHKTPCFKYDGYRLYLKDSVQYSDTLANEHSYLPCCTSELLQKLSLSYFRLPHILNISTSSKCWESCKISLVTRNFIGFPKKALPCFLLVVVLFDPVCFPSNKSVQVEPIPSVFTVIERLKFETRDARSGHFLDQPDKIKNHRKQKSRIMRRIWVPRNKLVNPIQNAKNYHKKSKGWHQFPFLLKFFLILFTDKKLITKREATGTNSSIQELVLYLGNHHISTFKNFQSKTRIRCQEISAKHQMVDSICLDTFGYHRFKQL